MAAATGGVRLDEVEAYGDGVAARARARMGIRTRDELRETAQSKMRLVVVENAKWRAVEGCDLPTDGHR